MVMVLVSQEGEPKSPTSSPVFPVSELWMLAFEGSMEAEERKEESNAKEQPGENGWVRRFFMKICLDITRSDRSRKQVRRTTRHVDPLRGCTRLTGVTGDADVSAKKNTIITIVRILSGD